jgi:predicted enzyme related to lactoylglutathione lyase
MAASLGLVLDCADPDRLADFWSAAIGYKTVGSAGNYVLLVDEAGHQPKLLLQRVAEPKAAKNRMHIDIEIPDAENEATRLERLGAVRVEGPFHEHNCRWIVMNDPEGNEFCLCTGGQSGTGDASC